MDIIFFTFYLMEAARGQKHPSDAENGMKESIHCKKFLMKVAQQPQKTQLSKWAEKKVTLQTHHTFVKSLSSESIYLHK